MKRSTLTAIALTALALMLPTQAFAFCGFYVSGADEKMFNDATQVVMMRRGTTTVLSMRNTYEGPPKDFAMVVPVPVVLEEADVKVLPDHLFKKVDALSAPRLVEYWERNPCPTKRARLMKKSISKKSGLDDILNGLDTSKTEKPAVRIEAQFEVGEYDVVVLSADESNALETWLKQNKYNIPKGAAGAMAPYIQQGMYFFVAKVDPKKIAFENGKAALSPLRFHYESDDFQLPVRLGMLNAKGEQDLIVNILAPKQRYAVANKPNVTIPTNLIVKSRTRKSFGGFYNALFDYTLEQNPGSVVTEYAWQATKCDPCPSGAIRGMNGALNTKDIMSLGGDVLSRIDDEDDKIDPFMNFNSFVLTRLHTRYTKKDPQDDLVFVAVDPIVGGTGMPQGPKGDLALEGVNSSDFNQFQGRYIILNTWKKKTSCKKPRRGPVSYTHLRAHET